jgi:hypothetical protein
MNDELLEKMNSIVGQDTHAESALEDLGLLYAEVEEGEWEDEGKYQYQYNVFGIEGRYFGINTSRNGSYFSDYNYTIDSVEEVKKAVVYTVKATDTFVPLGHTQDLLAVADKCEALLKALKD